jgi:DNA-binding FadR family transcriptional regulator
MSKVRVQKLGEQVVRLLGARIVSGEYSENQPLPSEHEISQEFGVSRTVAREVTRMLESLDLISVSQGRRVTMRPRTEWDYLNPLLLELHSPEDIRRILGDLHDVRLLLEPEIAAMAAERATPDLLASMQAAIRMMEQSENEPDQYLENDLAFHIDLVWACNNVVLSRIVQSSRGLLAASRLVTQLIPGGLPIATAGHKKIFEAVAAGDPDKARRAMRDHVEFASKAWLEEKIPIEFGARGDGEHQIVGALIDENASQSNL